MAVRQIKIDVDLENGQYQAKVREIIDLNNKWSSSAVQGAQRASTAMQTYERSTLGVRAAFQPLNIAVQQLTGTVGDLSPQLGIASRAIGNLSVNILQASHDGGGFMGIIRAATSLLNPWTLAVVAGGTALAIYFNKVKEAKEEQEKFAKAMKTGDVDFFAGRIDEATQRLEEHRKKLQEVIALQQSLSAPAGSPLAQRQAVGNVGLQKNIDDAAAKLAEAEKQLAEARRTKALQSLPDLEKELALRVRLAEASERARPGIEAEAKAQDLLAKGLTAEDAARAKSLLTREAGLRVAEIDRKASEQAAAEAKRLAEQLAAEARRRRDAEADAIRGALAEENAIKAQIVALRDGSAAAEALKLATLEMSLAQKLGAENAKIMTDQIRAESGELGRLKQVMADLAASAARFDEDQRQRQEDRAAELQYLERRQQLLQANAAHEINKLRVAGAPEAQVLQRQLELLKQQEAVLRNLPEITVEQNRQHAQILQQIELEELRLQQMGKVSINIGQHVGNTLNDIFTALITGTLKSVDIGKSALATVGRIATDIFQQTLTKKLSFEFELFNNLRGLPGQANNAFAAGAAALPGGAQGGGVGGGIFGGIGNFIQSLFVGGGQPAGLIGPLLPNGNFFSGGGGIGSLFGLLPGGTSLGGLATSALGGFGLAKLTGAGGLGQILSSVGSLGGTLLGATGFGAGITSSITGALGGLGLSSGLAGTLGSFALPGIGSVIGLLLGGLLGGGLFGGVPNPTVNVRTKLEGFLYDELQNIFKVGKIKSTGTGTDIDQSTVTQVTNQVQRMLKEWSNQWADILNLFPEFVHDEIIPSLDHTNQLLNKFFGQLKFSEGGSRSIQQELQDLSEAFGPKGFFAATRGSIGAGLSGLFNQLGFSGLATAASEQFAPVPTNIQRINVWLGQLEGLKPPNKKDLDAFIESIQTFIQLTGSLTQLGGGGIRSLLPEADVTNLEAQIGQVLKIRTGTEFIKGVEDLQERIGPVMEFLQSSIQESTNLFGRGLVAALDAAAGQAVPAFNQVLGAGVKEMIFKGITEGFIASSQFNDLLAPIQKTIREFTQQAIESGTTPDIGAFRAAILPQVEDITTRAETLEPLIAELRKLGFDVKDALKALSGKSGGGSAVINFNGPVSMNNEQDAEELLRRIDNHLNGLLSPN